MLAVLRECVSSHLSQSMSVETRTSLMQNFDELSGYGSLPIDRPPPYTQHEYSQDNPSNDPTSDSLQIARYPSGSSKLHKPITIPDTTPRIGSPLLRACPPALQGYNISQDLFLRFLDDLNRAIAASPPLRILKISGDIISNVPEPTAQIVGGALSAAASVSTVAMSMSRMEILLRDVNRTVFHPTGLRVATVKTKALAAATNMPILTEAGKIDKNASLLRPPEAKDLSMPGQERRLDAFRPWVADLDLQPIPQIFTPNNPLSR